MKNNDFSIVLGYPYWNATYWLVSAENWRNAPLKSEYDGGHGYYQNLYRFNNLNVLDEVASLMLLYDEVYISPADCPLPDYSTYTNGSVYSNHNLGFYSSWDWIRNARENDELIKLIIRNIDLRFLPNFSTEQLNNLEIILTDIVTQISLAIEFNCSLLIGKEFEYIYKFAASFLDLTSVQEKINNASNVNESIKTIQTTTGFLFNLNSFREFEELRGNKTVRNYATALRDNLSKFNKSDLDELSLLESMMNAINTSEISGKIGSGLNVTSKLLSFASLVPVVGTPAGVGSLMTDFLNKKREDYSPNWWSLFPEIEKALTKYRIEQRYNELKKIKGIA